MLHNVILLLERTYLRVLFSYFLFLVYFRAILLWIFLILIDFLLLKEKCTKLACLYIICSVYYSLKIPGKNLFVHNVILKYDGAVDLLCYFILFTRFVSIYLSDAYRCDIYFIMQCLSSELVVDRFRNKAWS